MPTHGRQAKDLQILFLLDPPEILDPEWDNSLCLVREFVERGHYVCVADYPDMQNHSNNVFVRSRPVRLVLPMQLSYGPRHISPLTRFNLIVIRKEPPFDMNYIYLTYMLDRVAAKVMVSNNPTGIRNTNEKMAIFHFSKWLPETLVTCANDVLNTFHRNQGTSLVIKPLDQRGGLGIRLVKTRMSKKIDWNKMTHNQHKTVMAQRFLRPAGCDKRIVLLQGKLLAAYEKRSRPGEFRSNLSQGGSFHATELTRREKEMIQDIRPYCVAQGLHLVGLDVMQEKLLEINVTCPAGIVESMALYHNRQPIEAWADFLEAKSRKKR